MVTFLVARESFTRWSSGPLPVHGIICLLEGQLGIWWWAPSPCVTQLLQLVNLTLPISFIFCMGDMALPSWLTLTSMHCMHTSFMISPSFTIELLCWEPPDSAWCRLTLSWCGPIVGWCELDSSIPNTRPEFPSNQIKLSPQTAPIVRTNSGLDTKTRLGFGPTSPNNKFVECGRKN